MKTSIVKQSRREGYALHPKALKAMVKRTNMPGQQPGKNFRQKSSQYSLQLREKQKVKRLYGLLEKQFSNLMAEANRTEGQSGQVLLRFLEQRLDNVVYRAGFAPSRPAARQLVTHGHFMLNGRRVDIPSIRVKAGDEIVVRTSSVKNSDVTKLDDISPEPGNGPSWLKVNRKKLTVTVSGEPTREESEPDINEQLIVEYYSR